MAINKELYERYKAMKAAKLATGSNTVSETVSDCKTGIGNNITSSVVQNTSQNIIQPENTVIRTDGNTLKKFALIGYPLGHSLSEYIHKAGFASLGINATYELIETPPDMLVDRIKYLKNSGYAGFNVTIPLKLPVTMFLDEIDSSANTVNAINTVSIDPQTKFLKGYNTDAAGFERAIPKDFSLCAKTAGILGTGGAARAAVCALARNQIKEIKFFTRNVANSIEFLEYLRKTYQNIAKNILVSTHFS